MAVINIDDAYILNETGAQVDKTTGIPFKNESLTEAEAAQARANIRAGGSNPNLLDNAYFIGGGSQLGDGIFPINQRGQTQYTGGGVQLDRWHGWAGDDTLVLTANGLEYTSPSSNGLFQYFPVFPTTQTVTFSVKVNGTITSITIAEGTIHAEEDFSGYKLTVDRNDKCVGIFSLNETILLQAAKLEVGTVSTLANDAPPDFGEELRKCQRYLFVLDIPAYFYTGSYAVAGDGTHGTFVVHTPVNMASPVITASIQGSLVVSTHGPIASIQWATAFSNAVNIAFALSSGSMVNGVMYPLQTSTVTKLILSCEL